MRISVPMQFYMRLKRKTTINLCPLVPGEMGLNAYRCSRSSITLLRFAVSNRA